MKPEIFIEYLAWLKLPRTTTVFGDVTTEFLSTREIRATPISRKNSLKTMNAPESIQSLYGWNDLSNIHMLWTSFLSEPRKTSHGWQFASMSETLIILSDATGMVEAYNEHPIAAIHGNGYLGTLSKNLECYLEALLCGAMNVIHFAEGFTDEPDVKAKRESIANLCATLAGGNEYYDFWAGLLGL